MVKRMQSTVVDALYRMEKGEDIDVADIIAGVMRCLDGGSVVSGRKIDSSFE